VLHSGVIFDHKTLIRTLNIQS